MAGRLPTIVCCLLLVGCTIATDAGADDTTQPTQLTTTVTGVTTTTGMAGSTTTPLATTTSSTMASATTTTTLGGVTVDQFIPPARSRSDIPWADVGPGWFVALYESDKADPSGPGDVRDGPAILYLVAPDGILYETHSWPGGMFPGPILDVRPDGTAVLLALSTGTDVVRFQQIDTVTGSASQVLERDWPETSYGNFPYVISFTRPSGMNHVVFESDGIEERVVRRSGGTTVATLYAQDHEDGFHHLSWLYGHEGTSVVIGHSAGMAVVSNLGELERDLWVPPDRRCDPVRWWDADTIVATCTGGPAVAPHDFYHQLWFIEIDGTAGVPLTTVPADVFVGDFGFFDAWFRSAGELVQWSGDCGAGEVRWWDGDEGVPFGVTFPGADGYSMVGIYDISMGVYAWLGCGQDVGFLYSVDTTDLSPTELLGPVDDARGVVSVVGLAELYP